MYNPQSLQRVHREAEIAEQLRSCTAIGLVGTCLASDLQCSTGHVNSFFKLQWPRAARCTGLALWTRRDSFPRSAYRGMWAGTGKLSGRVAAARFKTAALDVLFVLAYLPPGDDRLDVTDAALAWISRLLERTGHRVLPILLMDANAHVGLERTDDGEWALSSNAYDALSPVGDCNPARTNANGARLLTFAAEQRLTLVNTHYPCSPTFYSNDGRSASRVDYVLVPAAQLELVETCAVWKKAGDALQPIDTPGRREHRPVVVSMRCGLSYTAERQ